MAREFEGPGTISVSGGRTSALMLRRMMDAGALSNPDLHVVFANTCKAACGNRGGQMKRTDYARAALSGVKVGLIQVWGAWHWLVVGDMLAWIHNRGWRPVDFGWVVLSACLFVLGFCFVLLGEQMEDADVAAYESRARAEIEAGR